MTVQPAPPNEGRTRVGPDDPAVRAAARAWWCGLSTGVLFTGWAWVTTQVRAIALRTPWQDDPYHGVVSFTGFLVPAVLVLVLVRAALWRRRRPQPVFRVDQISRAGLVGTALVGLTVLTDGTAVAFGADRQLWDDATPWLVASLVPLALLTTASLLLHGIALRRLPDAGPGAPAGDWLDDLSELAQRVSGRRVDRPIEYVRSHVVLAAVLLSLVAGTGVAAVQAFGEGGESPLLFGVSVLVGFGGFLAFCLVCDAVLQIAVPRGPAPQRRFGGRVRRAARITVIVSAVALPAAAVLRDRIWQLLGHHEQVDAVATYAAITVISALVAGGLAFAVAMALSTRRIGADIRARQRGREPADAAGDEHGTLGG